MSNNPKEYERTRAKERRAAGLCANCNDGALPGESRCGEHLRRAAQTTINQATGGGTTHMKTVRLDQLQPNPWQPRTTVDPEYIDDLANDILSVGRLLQEPLTRPSPTQDGFYQMAFGHSRVASLRRLHAQKKWPATVTVKVSDLSDKEMAYTALSENRARKDLTPLEEINAWSKALEIDGVTIQALADRVGVDRSTMSKNLAILKLPDVALEHVSDGRLSLRAARELLSLRTDTHMHDDMIEAVLKDCGGDQTQYHSAPPDFRVTTVRESIKALTRGRAHRYSFVSTGHHEQDRNWRPLFQREDGDGGRAISFNLDDFERGFADYIHILPEGAASGGQPWTCQVKEWSRWSARATREQTKAEAEVSASAAGANGKAPAKAEPKPKGSRWLQAVKKDPVVQERLGPKELRKFKTADDLSAEDREALGTRVVQPKGSGYYTPDVFPLPRPGVDVQAVPQAFPPFFDFSECATCTVGAAWGEQYSGGEITFLCTNKQLYMDKQSQGIEKFLVWRDQRAARDQQEDLALAEDLAADLAEGLAQIITMSNLDYAGRAEYLQAWGDGHEWAKYDVVPAAAEQFAQMVGARMPTQDYYEQKLWAAHLEQFFAAPPEDFNWLQAAAFLLVWKARIWAGLGVELKGVAQATEKADVAA